MACVQSVFFFLLVFFVFFFAVVVVAAYERTLYLESVLEKRFCVHIRN